ncbi:MAG TPA: NAD-dependent epimerase/dehydratase family protein [Burkholderiaceae bacterium]
MNRESILLLGGGGFIGSALAKRLATQGMRVHVVSRHIVISPDPNVIMHTGDLSDLSLLKKILPECATVVHLASISTPGSSATHPTQELNNIQPVLQLLEKLQDQADTHLIFLSSGGTVYGNPAQNPVAESAALAPLSFYGAGKVAIEGFLSSFRNKSHAVTILRPSNTYGPEQNINQGFGLIRTVLQHILQGTPIEIWGDGENVRDFIYIEDVVDAIVLVINTPDDSNTYNVGCGQGHTINEVLTIAQQICGLPLQINYHVARGVDVREVVLDFSHIRTTLGWHPHVSLDDGIQRTWQWLKRT